MTLKKVICAVVPLKNNVVRCLECNAVFKATDTFTIKHRPTVEFTHCYRAANENIIYITEEQAACLSKYL